MASEMAYRAQRLLTGGLIGAHIVGIATTVGFWVFGGREPGVTAAVCAVVVVAFFTIGQAVQIRVADRAPKTVLFASLVSYVARVTALGVMLWLLLANQQVMSWVDPIAAILTTVLVAQGWLFGEIFVYRRMRIPAYDSEYRAPSASGDDVA